MKNYLHTNLSKGIFGGIYFLLIKRIKIFIILILVFYTNQSQASHYRYATVSWSRTNTTTREVTFIIKQAYRINYFVALPGAEVVGNTIPTEVFNFGDGTTAQINLLVTSVNTDDSWFYGVDTLIHDYTNSPGNSFMAYYASCCRLEGLPFSQSQNNPDGDYSLQTVVNFVANNLGSPVCTLAPVIELAKDNPTANFTIPIAEPDGSNVTFVLSTPNEAADGSSSYLQPLGLSVNSTSGMVTFSTVGKDVGHLYNSAITMTDVSGTKTMVDFIIKIVDINLNPVFISPTPLLNSLRVIPTCALLRDTIKATTSSSVTTQILSASIPIGATLSNAVPTSFTSLPTTILNWTPLPSDYGIKTISYTAKNSNNLITNHSYQVVPNSVPYFISIPNTIACVGTPYSYSIIAIDPDVYHGDVLQTSLYATSLPPWLSYTSTGNGTGILSGTPTFSNIGSHTISFIAQDIYNSSHPNVIQTFTISVGFCTISTIGVRVKAKVMLCGALDANTGMMYDSLRAGVALGDPTGVLTGGFILIPYLIPPHIPSLPTHFPPINGATIGSGVLSVSGSNAIVDWVYVEIRNASNNSIVVASQHALVQRDGDIVSSSDGISPLFFPTLSTGNYWVTVRHRNHLGVMTANSIPLAFSPGMTINFSDPFIPVWTKPCVENNARCNFVVTPLGCIAPLWGGDALNNRNVKYNGFANDREAIFNALPSAPPGYPDPLDALINYGYRNEDVNMNGRVKYSGDNNDKDWLLNEILNSNFPVATPNDVLEEHLPN